MHNGKRFGVGLSGGGYRAAAFHIGTLKKLRQLNILEKVDVLSTISGGSITGAAYCLNKDNFDTFEIRMVEALSTKCVIKYILTSRSFFLAIGFCLLFLIPAFWLVFTNWAPLFIVPIFLLVRTLLKYQFKIFPVSSIIEKAYDKYFYNGAKLTELCITPELAIGSTNLQTSRPFTFSKRKMEDSSYAYLASPVKFEGAAFPLVRAVMASSCVPFAFTPISIDKEFYVDYVSAMKMKVDPKLVDGGVYDNQGVQKLTQDGSSYSCNIVLVSDAGNKLPYEKSYSNTFTLLLRTVDTFMVRIKNFQMAQNIFKIPIKREVAYQSLGWDLENSVPGFFKNLKAGNISNEVIVHHQLKDEWIKSPHKFEKEILVHMENRCLINEIKKHSLNADELISIRSVGTNLKALPEVQVKNLIRHAADLTEIQLRLYCPSLFN